MPRLFPTAALFSAMLLTACGADPAPEPVEQIIVREPGSAPANTATGAANGGVDILIAAGKAAFANCSACHTLEEGGASGVGPNLFGVVGTAAGTATDFAYSDALKTSGITWTAAELDDFITDPAAKIPGTTMVAGAVAEPAERKAIIAYLESATDS